MAYVNLGQVIYPIGAIFASTSSTSPSSMFGGTWSQIVDDACLMACPENSGTYGGSKKITITHLPPHRHTLQNQVDNFELTPAHQITILCGQGNSKIFAWPDGQQSTYLTGGGRLLALLLQMPYVETHCLAVRSELASQAKEKNSLIAVMLYA